MTCDSKVRSGNWFRRALVALVIFTIGSPAANTSAQGPPIEVTIPVIAQGKQTKFDFRYIPAGKISKVPPHQKAEEPVPGESSLLASLGDQEVAPFYMSKTELTFQQLRAVLSENELKTIRERIQRTTGKDTSTEYLRSAVDENDYPAFAITLGEAVTVCQRLTATVNSEQKEGPLSIESRQVRLPSHFEWQFACRATNDPKNNSLPHFNRWIDADALNSVTREMLKDEWVKAGRNVNDFSGTQLQVLDLIDTRLGSPDAGGIPEKILSAYFKACFGRERDFSSLRSVLTPVANGKPNAWQLFDMHDNVCEWALVVNSREELNALWASLENPMPNPPNKKCLLLVGGGFSQSVSQKGAWKSFTIWGGYPADPETGDPAPMELTAGLDTSDRGQAVEMNAGVRLVMDRKLLPEWFIVVRQAALKQDAASVAQSFQRFRTTVAEIASAQETPRITAMLDAYEAIAEHRTAPERVATPSRLIEALKSLSESNPGANSGKPRLSQLLAQSSSTAPKPAQSEKSENDVFFAAAGRVFGNSQQQ